MTSCFEHIAKAINYQETRYLPHQLSRKTCEGKGKPSESTASVTITRTISSHESSSLANFSPVHVSVHSVAWFLYSPSKKLVFVPVASATDGGHRDCPVLASVAQLPEIQPLVSRGQIVSAVLPLLTDRQTDTQTDNYNFSIMMWANLEID